VALSFLSGSQGTVPSDSELAVWAVRPKSLSGVPEPASGMLVMASLVTVVLVAGIDPFGRLKRATRIPR